MISVVETKDDYYNALGAKIKGASFYLCEEEADVSSLPTKVGIGSRALVIPTGSIYMLGPSKRWIKYAGVSIMN
jgi:hypothetical protein